MWTISSSLTPMINHIVCSFTLQKLCDSFLTLHIVILREKYHMRMRDLSLTYTYMMILKKEVDIKSRWNKDISICIYFVPFVLHSYFLRSIIHDCSIEHKKSPLSRKT